MSDCGACKYELSDKEIYPCICCSRRYIDYWELKNLEGNQEDENKS